MGRTSDDQAALRLALNRYLAARSARGSSDPRAVRELATARLALVGLLQDAGWEPPPALRDTLAADARAVDARDRRSA